MSEKANPRTVGVFVVGAIVIVVAAVLALGTGQLFKTTDKYVAFFEGSVRGLQIGAPVTFRGVPVGEVKQVFATFTSAALRETPEDVGIRIEVVFELDASTIHDPGHVSEQMAHWDSQQVAAWATERGFSATLETQSLLTGQKYIDIDIRPDALGTLTGIESEYPEWPTRSTGMARLQKQMEVALQQIAALPIEQIGTEILSTLEALRELANSPEFARAAASIDATMQEFGAMARSVDEDITRLVTRLEGAADATRGAMQATESTMGSLEVSTDKHSQLQYEIHRTLDELRDAAHALRLLAEYLEQHPEALLTGRGEEN